MKKLAILISVILVMSLLGGFVTSCSSEEKTTAPAAAPATTAAAAAPATKAEVKTKILKFASAATADYVPDEQAMVDAMNARIGPAYKIEYYPAGQLLAFPEILDGIRTGGVEMGAVTTGFHASDDARLGFTELPFLQNNIQAHSYSTRKYFDVHDKILQEKFNAKLLNLHNYMGMALIGTRPVHTLEDFDGMLIQAISPVFADFIKALGAEPVSGQPYTEAYQLMEKKVFDGTIQAPSSMVSYALYDVAKHMTSAYLVAATHGFAMNLEVWNSLPKDVQTAISEVAAEYNDIIDQFVIDIYDQDHADLAANGVEIFYPDQQELNRWREAVKPLYDKAKAADPEVYQIIKSIADEANAKFPIE
ncbi:MAG: TRAP transporter substrate-binding protein [Dehalococcoidales bacterium]|nr:TRAP transporter substrate-binding protein [Dehalococcoidales bacterium]